MAAERCVVIDYGSGNLRSAAKAFERAALEEGLSIAIEVASTAEAVRGADRIVLPGVGAFADCRRGLDAIPGLVETLDEQVLDRGKPFLGICVGMQLMAERGLEFTTTPGFGWIAGDVVAIRPPGSDTRLKIPHMGWNELEIAAAGHPVLAGIENGRHAYFVHSYRLACTDATQCLASVDYGGPIAAIVGRDNIVGTQFHPEKSQETGLRLIGNFLRWQP